MLKQLFVSFYFPYGEKQDKNFDRVSETGGLVIYKFMRRGINSIPSEKKLYSNV